MSLLPRIALDPEPPGRDIAMMLTRRCNMTCGHCSVESGPDVRGEPSEDDLLAWVRAAAAAGVRSIRFTGGEPMLRPATVLRLVRECRRLGIASTITTNGSWGRNASRTKRQLRALDRAGLGGVTLSYDRYHAAFQGPAPVLNIARAAGEQTMPVRISLVRGTDEADLAKLIGDLEGAPSTTVRVYDLQPVGRARELPVTLYRGELDGFCGACAFPAVTDDGRLVACNGPSYFEKAGSPLVLGSLRERSFADLLEQHRRDPILDVIRTKGPAGLRDELKRTPGFETFPFRSQYSGICELCHHITRDEAAVTVLRDRLMRPEAVATRLALWQVIDGSRKSGSLSTGYVNGVGACRVFLRAALDPLSGFGHDAEHVLGRADVDWRAIADYLCGSGLARPLLPVLNDRAFNRWAPSFFRDSLQARGVADGMRELVQRDALQHIGDALQALGGRGVLLKGIAFLLGSKENGQARHTHDIDILVDPELASPLRDRLIAAGFDGQTGAPSSTFQHLQPIVYQGLSVEIHTRIMAPFWGLPEREMLADTRPIPGSQVFSMLGPEGLILHAVTHASAGFFSFGLKCAWDILTVLRSGVAIDWDRLAKWANMTGLRRAFWIPMRLITEELGVPVPATFLQHAPTDSGARRIEIIARHRLFRSTESIFDLDALTKAGLMFLLHDTLSGRARYLATKISWRGSRPSTWSGMAGRARRADVLRQAWRRYLRYRRALRRPAVIVQAADS